MTLSRPLHGSASLASTTSSETDCEPLHGSTSLASTTNSSLGSTKDALQRRDMGDTVPNQPASGNSPGVAPVHHWSIIASTIGQYTTVHCREGTWETPFQTSLPVPRVQGSPQSIINKDPKIGQYTTVHCRNGHVGDPCNGPEGANAPEVAELYN